MGDLHRDRPGRQQGRQTRPPDGRQLPSGVLEAVGSADVLLQHALPRDCGDVSRALCRIAGGVRFRALQVRRQSRALPAASSDDHDPRRGDAHRPVRADVPVPSVRQDRRAPHRLCRREPAPGDLHHAERLHLDRPGHPRCRDDRRGEHVAGILGDHGADRAERSRRLWHPDVLRHLERVSLRTHVYVDGQGPDAAGGDHAAQESMGALRQRGAVCDGAPVVSADHHRLRAASEILRSGLECRSTQAIGALMLRWFCLIFAVVIIVVSVVEYVWHATPFEQIQGDFGLARTDPSVTVIRLGVASWQMNEFPWEETVRRYEKAKRGKVRIKLSVLPEGSFNSLLLFWRYGYTEYDVVVAFADEEIHPFIDYNWNTTDPARRSLLINVRDYLSEDKMNSFVPALLDGASRKDPNTGKMNCYELPWMGEVLALNYNKKYFQQAGIKELPKSWEEVEQVCERLKRARLTHQDKEVAPLAMNFAQRGFFAQNCYIPMLAAFKKGRGIKDDKGRLDVASPEAVKVFATLKRWYKAGYVTARSFVSERVEQELRTLDAVMYPHWQSRGLWAVDDHGPQVIGLAPTPGAQEAGSLIATYGCIIPKCSPVKKEAAEICYELFCTDQFKFQSAVAKGFMLDGKKKGGNKMPATKQIYDHPDLPPGVAELGRSLNRGYSYPDPTNWAQCAEILVVEFQKYLRDKTPTAEEALANVRERYADEVYTE
ncbi:MAG: hypothetical protein AMK75_07175 [Planctomycetes bacterium SM23_65]|nr:MAG: hypothetical protein AMK75_07175 [Planctomycetes bacterium SM23_65]